jgi:hypothetical protein
MVAIGLAGYRVVLSSLGYQWLVLASLTILTGPLAVRIPGHRAKISVAETIIITNLLLFGPAIGCLTAGLDGLMGSLRCKSKSRRLEFMLFNVAVMGLSAYLAGEAFSALVAKTSLNGASGLAFENVLIPLGMLTLVYYLINTLTVAAVIGLDHRQNIYRIWKENFLWSAANYVTAAVTAGLLALITRSITPAVLATVLAILISSFFACRNYLGKVAHGMQYPEPESL